MAKISCFQKTNIFSYGNVIFLLISSSAIVEEINSDGQSDTMYGTSGRDQASIHDGPFAACWWSGFFLSHCFLTIMNTQKKAPSNFAF